MPSAPLQRFRLPVVLLLATALAGCPEEAGGPTIKIVGLQPRRLDAVVDQPVVLEVKYTLEDGTPVEPFEVVDLGSIMLPTFGNGRLDVAIRFTRLGVGHRRYEVTPLQYRMVWFGQRVRSCATCVYTDTGTPIVLDPRPPTTALLPLDGPEISLAVNEARVLGALTYGSALTTINQPQYWATLAEVQVTSADPAIARVEGGRLVGVAPGTTVATLTATQDATTRSPAGRVSTLVTVTVVPAPLGPPPDGRRSLFFFRMDGNEGGGRWRQPHLASQLAIDSHGSPVAVGTPYGNIAELSINERPGLLAQWTGTGFETLPIGRPGEEVVSPHLALDSRDVRYVVYRNIASVLLGERKDGLPTEHVTLAILPPGETGFELRNLPLGAEPDAMAIADTILDRTISTSTLAITAREGGGVWVAWVFLRGHNAADGASCEATLRLAEVPPSGPMRVQDVARFSRDTGTRCEANRLFERDEEDSRTVVFDVTRRPGQTPDLVLEVGRDEQRPWSGRYALEGTTWTRSDFLSADDLRAQDIPYGPFALFPPRPSIDGSVPTWSHWGPPADESTFVDPRPEPLVGRGEPFIVQLGDNTWSGNQYMTLTRRSRFLGGGTDDPTPRWFEGRPDGPTFQDERRLWRVEGADARAGRIHLAISSNLKMDHGVVTPPRYARENDPESEGRAIELGGNDPQLRVAPSGVRWHFANGTAQGARLGRSTGPDLPWQFATLPERDVLLLPVIAEHDGKVWAFTQPLTGAGLTILSSADGGETFTISRTLTTQNRVRELVVRGGLLFALCLSPGVGQGELLRVELSNATSIPRDLATALLPVRLFEGVHLHDAGDGVAMLVINDTIVRWNDAGTLMENASLPFEFDDTRVLIEPGGVVTGLSPFGRPQIRRRDAGSATIRVIGSLGDDAFGSTAAPIRIGPGKLAIPLSVRTALRDCWQVALRLSDDDGVTWRTGPFLRSSGGCGQAVGYATAQGGFFTLQVGDNESLRGYEDGDVVSTPWWATGFANLRPIILRVPVP